MIKQFLLSETCLNCKGCCRFNQENSVWAPSLLNQEIEGLLKHGFSSSIMSGYKKLRIVPFAKEGLYLCPLFNHEENRCKIYDLRPLECQLYPFLITRKDVRTPLAQSDNPPGQDKEKRKIFLAADLKCLQLKERLAAGEFNAYVQYLVELLEGPHYAEILKNNPQIIQEYSEVYELQELHVF